MGLSSARYSLRRPPRWRLALALPAVLVALALSLLGCVGEQLRVAHALAIAGGALDAPARVLEREQGLAELERVHAAGGTRAEGEAALAAVEARWSPVFGALRLFLAADEEWLAALEAHTTGDFSALLPASCRLGEAARPVAPHLLARLDGGLGVLCATGGTP